MNCVIEVITTNKEFIMAEKVCVVGCGTKCVWWPCEAMELSEAPSQAEWWNMVKHVETLEMKGMSRLESLKVLPSASFFLYPSWAHSNIFFFFRTIPSCNSNWKRAVCLMNHHECISWKLDMTIVYQRKFRSLNSVWWTFKKRRGVTTLTLITPYRMG